MKPQVTAKRERNYGIDLLRILSMLFVCTFHVISKAGFTGSLPQGGARWIIVWLIQATIVGAVNIFAVISGYVGLNSSFKLKSILKLYLTVTFYSVLITALVMIIFPGKIDSHYLPESFLPSVFNFYWYYTAYFCLSFFAPFINKMIQKLTNKEAWRLIILILVFLSIIPTFFKGDIYAEGYGYSLIWIAALYVVGACLKKVHAEKILKNSCFLLIFFAMTIVSWFSVVLSQLMFDEPNESLVQYISPTITIAACAIVLFFANLNFKKALTKKVITLFSASAFSVYLIHTHPAVWRTSILYRIVGPTFSLPKPMQIPGIFICAIALYLVCSIIDFGRVFLFKKIAVLHRKCVITTGGNK